MELEAFALLVVPFMCVVYVGVLLFMRPPKPVMLASLLGGLAMGAINILFDLAAYYAHWWHYIINGLVLHLPLPFYASPILVYGGIAYLLIWRFRHGRGRWFALLLLFGVPLFRAALDIFDALTAQSYVHFDSVLAAPIDVIMWLLMFYAGYWVFTRLCGAAAAAPAREQKVEGVKASGTI
jgi:hypothetical protein